MTRRRRNSAGAPLRIAMVAACPFPSLRGSQVLIRELAQALAARGHDVHVVTYPYGESVAPIDGIRVHRVRPAWLSTAPTGLGWRKVILDGFLVWTLYRVVRRHGIQVIHAHNYEGPLISYVVRRLTGVPVVYHAHNALSDELPHYFRTGWRRRAARWVGGWLDQQVPRRADFSIALTAELETFLRTCGVAASRLAVVAPGSLPMMPLDGARGGADPFAGRFVVMYSGNLDPYQDLEVLCSGFERVRCEYDNALLVIVTHQANWAECAVASLRELVRQGLAQIIVAPAFSVVRRLLVRADVLVCPRSSWSGFPIKLNNYLASGRAVVVAEGSARGIIHGETGLVFQNRNAENLGRTIGRLAADPALRHRLGENARAAAGRYSWRRAVSQIDQIYAHVGMLARGKGIVRRTTQTGASWGLLGSSRGRISAASKGRSA
jgi:glycosyltransferase involved in cell wall biosynthesis